MCLLVIIQKDAHGGVKAEQNAIILHTHTYAYTHIKLNGKAPKR